MPTDEQIREMCARVLTTTGAGFESSIRELQSAIRQRLEGLSNQAVATMLRVPRAAASSEEERQPHNEHLVLMNDQKELDEVS
jgi:hypothetical protein